MKSLHEKRIEALARLEASLFAQQKYREDCMKLLKLPIVREELFMYGTAEAAKASRILALDNVNKHIARITEEMCRLSKLLGIPFTVQS